MLVVVVLITTLLALTIPTVTALTRNSRGDAGVNSVNTAVTVARAYALQSIAPLSIVNPTSYPRRHLQRRRDRLRQLQRVAVGSK